MTRRFRIGEFEFDPNSGELFREGHSLQEPCGRLSPQPAQLLSFLIEHSPEIVGLEQIRELLWPDVQIEFEQSLHFCVRQIRAALGDSATTPRFVETVPRRGYRLIADTGPGRPPAAGARVSAGPADQANPAAGERRENKESQQKRLRFSTVARWAIVLLLLPVAGFTLLFFSNHDRLRPCPEAIPPPLRRLLFGGLQS